MPIIKTLNGLRGLAAILVILSHLPQIESGVISEWLKFILYSSKISYFGVDIFFVLSGFLITRNILHELKKKSFSLKTFFLKRTLRIFPIYYITVILVFFVIDKRHFFELLLYFSNITFSIDYSSHPLRTTWSLAVEEQFYLIWPHVINKVKGKRTLFVVLCSFVMIAFIPRFICIFSANIGGRIQYLVDLIPIHFMAIGAIGAFFLFFFRNQVEIILNNKFLFIVNTFLVIISLFAPYSFIGFKVLFGFLALFQLMFITTIKAANNLAGDALEFVGSISYGVYMYHPFVMFICFAIFNNLFSIEENWLYNVGLYSSIFSLTIGLSYLSYNFFESKFIKLKKEKFTLISSGR